MSYLDVFNRKLRVFAVELVIIINRSDNAVRFKKKRDGNMPQGTGKLDIF